ncbi:MAG: hypothetical protein ABIQ07_08670 [Ginsengibacter sp.]
MKNIKTFRLPLIILFLVSSFASQAQRFDSVLAKLDREYKQEKMYLHFDRSAYTPGETIWFKAYLFTGNYPSLISKSIYAELLDAKGNVLERKTIPVIVSGAAGSFDLPNNLNSSSVYVRAYTKWMLNFDSSFLFTKAIPILNAPPVNNKPLPSSQKQFAVVTKQQPTFVLQFFAEGGDLVQDVNSRIAFKATDARGMPLDVSGNVTDNAGKKIVAFTSVHDGMGTFELQPQPGIIYKAEWKDNTGKLHETLLPAAKQNGVVLEVNNNSNQIEFTIRRSAKAPLPYPYVYVIAQLNQQLLYRARVNLAKSETAASIIPLENLPAGIVQLTLFTPDERPIAERITFINKLSASFITDLNAALKDMGKRKKNVIQIDVPDTIATNLSVAVTDADLDPVNKGENILSNILLTSDIKGYVHNAVYYFSSDADSVADHLDLVMMTNGWRRFNWDNVLSNRWPKILYSPDNYLSIEGQVSGLTKILLASKEINAVIELKDKKREFINTPVSLNGYFIFPEMIFYDTAKLFYQFNNDKNKSLTSRGIFDIKTNLLRTNLKLQPDSTLLLGVTKFDTVSQAKNIQIYKEQLSDLELRKVKTLKEITITGKKKSKQEIMDEQYSSGLFSGGESRIILPEDDPAFLSSQSVLHYLQGRIAGLQVSPNGAGSSITWRGSATSLFIDEITTDASAIENIPMSDVAMVKIFNPPFFGAFGGGAGGAIAVYRKKGAAANQSVKGLDYANIPGYSPIKEFYSPDYSKTDQINDNDYRKTLYWNPFVITDKTHRRIFLSFYNNDITKKLKVIIEGCNEEGKLTRTEKILQ